MLYGVFSLSRVREFTSERQQLLLHRFPFTRSSFLRSNRTSPTMGLGLFLRTSAALLQALACCSWLSLSNAVSFSSPSSRGRVLDAVSLSTPCPLASSLALGQSRLSRRSPPTSGSRPSALCRPFASNSSAFLISAGRETVASSPFRSENAFSTGAVKSLSNLSPQSRLLATATSKAGLRKKRLDSLSPSELRGKRVLVRADLNVPLEVGKERGEHGDAVTISNDARIRASLPTLRYLVDSGAKTIVCSHLGRPKTEEDRKRLSLKPVADRLQSLLGNARVLMAPAVVGAEVQAMADKMENGDILLLENVRFEKGETKNDEELSRKFANLADMFVNDAFGTAHRAHSSTAGVTQFVSRSVAGFLLQQELEYLSTVVANPVRPFAALVGGAKVSSKLGVLRALIEKVDKLVIGGAMAFTFLKARGFNVGASIVEDDQMEAATQLEALAKEKGVELIIPGDVVVADRCAADAQTAVVPVTEIPEGWMGLDNGPQTTARIVEALQDCKTVLWNGPMGMSEYAPFAAGTQEVARALAEITRRGGTTVVGGGDSVAAIERLGLSNEFSHVSTGGGASLELLEGKTLPGVAALSDEEETP
ncbi:phosphoglycerate kinase PGKII [Toxoplasma gondii ME49]|uniref:Phosphoglycerate kinase n=3 Tax=Toxoplasma gondii TaxID=5811 RepID=A0A2G8XV40_TOXGO|nr:phosphoglycerate kinase PGKII [Toxoplasma gondii ME49]EPT32037.1 phosphoglycerate kinase PGKII [Toxoplasma gondii ME49]KYF42611.1 phosphoglycerate kinase PGKII [Toxoplasma gondii ARI]PIL98885.1 phosphoglycerate kinase PGKII [Toxoplasma gondii COUG]|eukprot:XP_002370021.2 phosphoglycerate kinase PGKII [Toxoplasma gondii ME49]